MRFLVLIIVLTVTSVFVPYPKQEQPVETAAVQEKVEATTGAAMKYDEAIESPGIMTRLAMFDF
jgi:hypothetical protein